MTDTFICCTLLDMWAGVALEYQMGAKRKINKALAQGRPQVKNRGKKYPKWWSQDLSETTSSDQNDFLHWA